MALTRITRLADHGMRSDKIEVWHLIPDDYNGKAFGGVARFDYELRQALPWYVYTFCTEQRKQLPLFDDIDPEKAIFIAGNGDCLQVPSRFKCIAVHHGCAIAHKMREPTWPGDFYVDTQYQMRARPNTTFVATSTFTREMFKRHCGITDSHLIPHSTVYLKNLRDIQSNIILGDWRNYNKGKDAVAKLQAVAGDEFEFRQLMADKYDKEPAYKGAMAYLTLSLSEGCSYSQLDALHFGIPVLSTDVSLFPGDVTDECGESFPWYLRDDTSFVLNKLRYMRDNTRPYTPLAWVASDNNYSRWIDKWINLIDSL